jgi:hypothetical protein
MPGERMLDVDGENCGPRFGDFGRYIIALQGTTCSSLALSWT